MSGCQGPGIEERYKWEVTTNGYRVSLGSDEYFLELEMMAV